jgi:molecular chaperone GrpE
MSDTEDTTPPPESENPHAAEFAVLEALRSENAELKDQRLRALAEVENVRRIAAREKNEASQYAVTKFARDMLGIADNFVRAAADGQIRAVLDGVEATDRQLISALESHGVKLIDTSDGRFDPNLHQAIAEVPGNGKPAGSIVDVVQTGYTINGRLLRPAMVTVARKDAGAPGVDTRA